MSIVNQLALLHTDFNIYPEEWFQDKVKINIVNEIEKLDDENLYYLISFYRTYLQEYQKGLGLEKDKGFLTGNARSVDLPFIGNEVLKNKKAKYMIIFMGSLQEPSIMSITVLSHLWLSDNYNKYRGHIERFWKVSNYRNVFQKVLDIRLSKEDIQNSYVVDAFRIGDAAGNPSKNNRYILEKEIELLQPEYVITVGGEAKRILGNEKYRKEPSRYLHLNFVMGYHSGAALENYNNQIKGIKELIGK